MNVSSASAGLSPYRSRRPKLSGEGRDQGQLCAPGVSERRLLGKKLFSSARRRFILRLASLSPQLQNVQTAWRALLADLALPSGAEEALGNLNVETLYGYLRAGDIHSYESALARLGQEFAGRGVPEEYAFAALGIFFETCLRGLLGNIRDEDKEYVLGLAMLGSVSHLFLASGYASHRASKLGALEERVRNAEERAETLAINVSEANEKERRRISSDLHDEIGHDLVVLKLYLEIIVADVKENLHGEVGKKLREAIGLATRAIEAVRRLAFDLGPGIFDECGFVPAIRNYARRFAATTGVKVRVRVSLSSAHLQARDELALYRVLQGALSNVLRHSQAKAVSITVRSDVNSVSMVIEDEGRGFLVERKLRDSRVSFGLQAMRERVELLGGHFQIQSPATQVGKKRYGTRIEVALPLTQAEVK
jgi:signal transduction histidine kinase